MLSFVFGCPVGRMIGYKVGRRLFDFVLNSYHEVKRVVVWMSRLVMVMCWSWTMVMGWPQAELVVYCSLCHSLGRTTKLARGSYVGRKVGHEFASGIIGRVLAMRTHGQDADNCFWCGDRLMT